MLNMGEALCCYQVRKACLGAMTDGPISQGCYSCCCLPLSALLLVDAQTCKAHTGLPLHTHAPASLEGCSMLPSPHPDVSRPCIFTLNTNFQVGCFPVYTPYSGLGVPKCRDQGGCRGFSWHRTGGHNNFEFGFVYVHKRRLVSPRSWQLDWPGGILFLCGQGILRRVALREGVDFGCAYHAEASASRVVKS
jgi:hypothetical protein